MNNNTVIVNPNNTNRLRFTTQANTPRATVMVISQQRPDHVVHTLRDIHLHSNKFENVSLWTRLTTTPSISPTQSTFLIFTLNATLLMACQTLVTYFNPQNHSYGHIHYKRIQSVSPEFLTNLLCSITLLVAYLIQNHTIYKKYLQNLPQVGGHLQIFQYKNEGRDCFSIRFLSEGNNPETLITRDGLSTMGYDYNIHLPQYCKHSGDVEFIHLPNGCTPENYNDLLPLLTSETNEVQKLQTQVDEQATVIESLLRTNGSLSSENQRLLAELVSLKSHATPPAYAPSSASGTISYPDLDPDAAFVFEASAPKIDE